MTGHANVSGSRGARSVLRPQSEIQIQKQILQALAALGVLCWRNSIDRRGKYKRGLGAGSSDIVGIVPGSGRFFGLEVKKPGGIESDDQVRWLMRVQRAGGHAGVARSPKDAIDLMSSWTAMRRTA